MFALVLNTVGTSINHCNIGRIWDYPKLSKHALFLGDAQQGSKNICSQYSSAEDNDADSHMHDRDM